MKRERKGEKGVRAVVVVVVAWYVSCFVVRVLVTAVTQTTGAIFARIGPITNAFVSGSGGSDDDVVIIVVAGDPFQLSSERAR